MAPTLYQIRQALHPNTSNEPSDNLRIINTWNEYEDNDRKNPADRALEYMCYELEAMNPETGVVTHYFKAVKFLRVIRLPADAKQSTSFMDKQQQILAGVWNSGIKMIVIIANVIKPEPIGLLYLYGVQGVAESIKEAKERADLDYIGFHSMLTGTFRVLEIRDITRKEAEWLTEKMYNMEYMTVVRGIPKASRSGEDAGNKGVGGMNVNPDSRGTLEELITGMAEYEYILEVLTTGVPFNTLRGWHEQTTRKMTDWNSMLTGQKSVSFGLSLPMMYGANNGQSQGWSKAYTRAETANTGRSETSSISSGSSVGQSLSQTFGKTMGTTSGMSYSRSQSLGLSHTRGTSFGESVGESHGFSRNVSQSVTNGVSTSRSAGLSSGLSRGFSVGSSQGISASRNASTGKSFNLSTGLSQSQNYSQSNGVTSGTSYTLGKGQNSGLSHSLGTSRTVTDGNTSTHSVSDSSSRSVSSNYSSASSWTRGGGNSLNAGVSHTDNSSNSRSSGTSSGWNVGGNLVIANGGKNWGSNSSTSNTSGTADGTSLSAGTNNSWARGGSTSASRGSSFSSSHSTSDAFSTSHSTSRGASEGYTTSNGNSLSQSWGLSASNSASQSLGNSVGLSQSVGQGSSYSTSQGISSNIGTSSSENIGQNTGTSQSYGYGTSHSVGQSVGFGENYGTSHSFNIGQSESVSRSQTLGESLGQTYSESVSESASTGYGQSVSQSQSISNGQGYTVSNGTSEGTSLGTTGTTTMGTSSSMGLGPSFSVSTSHQWKDEEVQDLLEAFEFLKERLKESMRGQGAFYTYVYLAVSSRNALAAAQSVAHSTWQNEYGMIQPLQVLDLTQSEQAHMLYHAVAFSSDVTKENVYGEKQYKYCTVLLPKELVAYSHLPRISEGGVFTTVQDIPKFSVPSQMKGEIYIGTVLNSERWTMKDGYRTPFDYRIPEEQLMHGCATGASRSGKTVTAMRFIKELTTVRRAKTGKRLRIVVMDPKRDWRTLARYVEPERFNFYSMGNPNFMPIKLNPWKVPRGVDPQIWVDSIIDIYCRAYMLLERGKQMIADVVYGLFEEAGVFRAMNEREDWQEVVPELSSKVTFRKIYDRFVAEKANLENPNNKKGKAGNDTRDAYARLIDRLSCFGRNFAIESRLYGCEDGMGIDDLIGNDDVTVLESKGLEKTFKNFIFGAITSGFYKYAIAHGGFNTPDQYETVLVIEEANEVLTGSDTAGKGGGDVQLSGQSEFEEILDQSAGYGLFIFAITQKIADMPSSVIANCGIIFAGKMVRPEDVTVVVRKVGREERMDDRDLVKWFPRSPTGWFVCQSSRTFDFKDAEPVLVQVQRLNIDPPSNEELLSLYLQKQAAQILQGANA